MIRIILFSIAVLGFAGAASAGTTFTATMEIPRDRIQKIVVAKSLWSCQANKCTAELTRKSVNVRTCKKVVKEIGKVVEFSNANGALSEADLATCNSVAKQ